MNLRNSDYYKISKLFELEKTDNIFKRAVTRRYLDMLKTLEEKIEQLDDVNTIKVEIDNYITYYIGYKLATTYNTKEAMEEIKQIRKETNRLEELIKSIENEKSYKCKLIQSEAKGIMLDHMNEREIPKSVIEIYPKTKADLNARNRIIDEFIEKKLINDKKIKGKQFVKKYYLG